MNRAAAIWLRIVLYASLATLVGPLHAQSLRTEKERTIAGRTVVLRDGKLFLDGEWLFLKIGKPLYDFGDPKAVQRLTDSLDVLRAKGYNVLELNCYWHQIDPSGDGVPDVDLAPLQRLIDEITSRSMFACLSVETYGVGGGQIPKPFLEKHPDALAINNRGEAGVDTEYGFMTAIPSIFHPEYRSTVHRYIRELTQRLPFDKILWYETTVEPQYMGDENFDYSPHARRAYEEWLTRNKLDGPAWPNGFPVPESFQKHSVWNRFRAEALATWVNEDAAAFREIAGPHAYIAVDYLETDGPEMPNRNGDSVAFLTHLTSPDIIQVNWHWNLGTKGPNLRPYQNIRKVMSETGRRWAITEHMTLNGSDFLPAIVPELLENTLRQGTRLGWEFVNVAPISADPFTLYHDDWSPKPLMAVIDNDWPGWLERVSEVEAAASSAPSK